MRTRLFVVVGFPGAFAMFSTFTLDVAVLHEHLGSNIHLQISCSPQSAHLGRHFSAIIGLADAGSARLQVGVSRHAEQIEDLALHGGQLRFEVAHVLAVVLEDVT